MILERLVLENFRQFKGRQELLFSDLREKNVTIIHAENGFGKTTLLKALLWGFYGRDGLMGNDGKPDDFEKPDLLIHEGLALRSTDPNELLVFVQIVFKHDSKRYILSRSLSLAQQKQDAKKTDLNLVIMQDGQTYPQDRPQQIIQSIIPKGISRFLFFNGERINYLAEEQNSAKITDAIHQMLGLKLLSTTIDDLKHPNVLGRLRGELKNATSDDKRLLLEQLGQEENRLANQDEKQQQIQRNLEALADEIKLVNNKLENNKFAFQLQEKRLRLQDEVNSLKQELETTVKRLSKLISEDGYSLFTKELVKRGQEIVSELRNQGQIPARVLNTFLDELLECNRCICARGLEVGTAERSAVEKLLTVAGDQEFNNAVGSLDHAIGHIGALVSQTEEQLKHLNLQRLEIKRDIRNHEEDIEEIHQTLGSKKDEAVQELEAKRQRIVLQRDELLSTNGAVTEKIESLKNTVKILEIQIREIEDQTQTAKLAQRRMNAVENCAVILERIQTAETRDLRPLLNKKISGMFNKIMTKKYWAELTEDFVMRIRKNVIGGDSSEKPVEIDVALSTGERTVASLVFIASLVALAEDRAKIPTLLKGLEGSVYPVAIDSPFGSLSMFRSGVARYIPEFAPQVILFVSPEQYNGQVELALNESHRVGKRYFINYHGPTLPERAQTQLVINEQKYSQYSESNTEEYTELKEVDL
ncbi:AAA family ATPase [Desulfobacula sp.]|uniref:AAA family ATPase n=1 Tax=Desulfobacula sp. TaxID=2593537 RepID=UPI001ED7CA22|nr:AAA family ATPase [Desulfobacula sp.]